MASGAAWELVDEGRGRRAADFATLSEQSNRREYLAVQHRLCVVARDRNPGADIRVVTCIPCRGSTIDDGPLDGAD